MAEDAFMAQEAGLAGAGCEGPHGDYQIQLGALQQINSGMI